MDIDLLFKIAAIGIIVAVLNQLLVRSGREDQAMLTTLAGEGIVFDDIIIDKEASTVYIKDKDVIIDVGGNKYVTGSESFFTRFIEIFQTMAEDAPGEEYQIECYKKPSKNYAGKSFISCSLV